MRFPRVVPLELPVWPAAAEAALQISTDSHVLQAAAADLAQELAGLHLEGDAALSFTDPYVDIAGVTSSLVVEVQGHSGRCEVRLTRPYIDVAIARGIPPLALLASVLVLGDRPEAAEAFKPKRVGEARRPSDEFLQENRRFFQYTEALDQATGALEAGRDVVLVGDHGAGKTVIAANIADSVLDKGRVVWLNLADPADGPESIVTTLLQTPRVDDDGKYLIVVNGLDANAPTVDGIFKCVAMLRAEFGMPVRVLATVRRFAATSAEGFQHQLRGLVTVPVAGNDMIRARLAGMKIAAAAADEISRLADNDVYIADTVIALCRDGQVPSRRDLQVHYTAGVSDPVKREALYVLACLGVFGLELTRRSAHHDFQGVMEVLVRDGLVRRSDGAYTIGHHRRAELVMQHALREWDAENLWGAPADIVWQHVQRGGERLIKATLSRLDLITPAADLAPRSVLLLSAWQGLSLLGRHIDAATHHDATWGGNLGAAVFAANALAKLGYDDTWLLIATSVRDAWCYNGDPLPRPVGGPSADYADFEEIKAMMRGEDDSLREAPSGMKADEVSDDLFYRGWALGLLLGMEGTAPAKYRDQALIDKLVASARKAQAQEQFGNFHPRRVPWLTARVVLGLAQAGLRFDNDKVVEDACRWLVQPVKHDGAFQGWWVSGTGSWNSADATTAMCLTALIRAGAPSLLREDVRVAYARLNDRERVWSAPGHEIDLAQVLEAILRGDEHRAGVYDHLTALRQRVVNELKNPALATPKPERSLRLPFIAAQLADLVWIIARRDCVTVFRDILARLNDADEHAGNGRREHEALASSIPASAEVPTVSLTATELHDWRNAAEQVRVKINEQVDKRTTVHRMLPTGETSAVMRRFLDQRTEVQKLTTRLGPATPRAVLRALDEIGKAVCGAAWPILPGLTDDTPGSDGPA